MCNSKESYGIINDSTRLVHLIYVRASLSFDVVHIWLEGRYVLVNVVHIFILLLTHIGLLLFTTITSVYIILFEILCLIYGVCIIIIIITTVLLLGLGNVEISSSNIPISLKNIDWNIRNEEVLNSSQMKLNSAPTTFRLVDAQVRCLF